MAINGIISQEDIQKLVTQSLADNYKRLDAIQAMKARYQTQEDDWEAIRSAATDLKSALDALKSTSTFYSRTAASSDSDIVTAVADSDAPIGTYNLTNIILAQAAMKASAGTLDLSSAGHTYYESTASVGNVESYSWEEDGTNITDWNNADSGGVSTQTTFDGAEAIRQNIAAPAAGYRAYLTRNVGPLPDQFSIEARMYPQNLGTLAGNNYYRMTVALAGVQIGFMFASDGLYAFDGSVSNEVGTNVVDQGTWTTWRFDVDAGVPSAARADVYKNGELVASGVDVSNAGTFTEGNIGLLQLGYSTAANTYVDYMKIATFSTNIVDENRKLDGSEGATNVEGAIADGSFTINGAKIEVDVSEDTLMEVLSKINESGAGVTATWDASADKMRLTVDEGGAQTITFGSDSSGFLSAMHIDTGSATRTGTEADWERAIGEVSALSGITDGYFTVNNRTFSVDTATDSLQDILSRINDSGAGVSAYYSEDLDKVVISANETGTDITFSGDTSNFITTILGNTTTAAHTAGSVDVNGQTITTAGNELTLNGVKFTLNSASVAGANINVTRDTTGAQTAIETYIEKYNSLRDIIDEKSSSTLQNDRLLRQISQNLRLYSIQSVTNSGNYKYLRDIGIEYSNGRLSLNASALTNAFNSDPNSVYKLFGYDTNSDGIRDDGGLSNTMYTGFLSNITRRSSGTVYQRTQLIQTRIERANADLVKYQKVIDRKETRLWAEYTQFADAVNAMSQQATLFNSQLTALNNLTSALYGSGTASS